MVFTPSAFVVFYLTALKSSYSMQVPQADERDGSLGMQWSNEFAKDRDDTSVIQITYSVADDDLEADVSEEQGGEADVPRSEDWRSVIAERVSDETFYMQFLMEVDDDEDVEAPSLLEISEADNASAQMLVKVGPHGGLDWRNDLTEGHRVAGQSFPHEP